MFNATADPVDFCSSLSVPICRYWSPFHSHKHTHLRKPTFHWERCWTGNPFSSVTIFWPPWTLSRRSDEQKRGKSLTSGYTFLFHKYILPKSINIHLASVPVKQKIHGNLLGRYRKLPSINYEPGGLRRLCARRVVFLSLFLPVCWSLIGFSYNTLLFERILSFLTKCSFLKETCQ